MRVRSELMIQLGDIFKERGLTQGKAAKLFGVTQPRVSELLRGKMNQFSLDEFIGMAALAGLSPRIKIKKAA